MTKAHCVHDLVCDQSLSLTRVFIVIRAIIPKHMGKVNAATTAWSSRHTAGTRYRPNLGSSWTLVFSVKTKGASDWPEQWRQGQALRGQGREEGEEEARGAQAELHSAASS